MSATAQFCAIPNTGKVRISGVAALNTARDGSGTLATNIFTLFTAGANGSYVDKIRIHACGTAAITTAGMIRIFIKDAVGITLYMEIPVTAVTPSASVAGFNNDATATINGGLTLKNGASLLVTSHISDTTGNQFDIIAEGGDY